MSWLCPMLIGLAVIGALVAAFLLDRRARHRGHRLRKARDIDRDIDTPSVRLASPDAFGGDRDLRVDTRKVREDKVFRGYEHSREERHAHDVDPTPVTSRDDDESR